MMNHFCGISHQEQRRLEDEAREAERLRKEEEAAANAAVSITMDL